MYTFLCYTLLKVFEISNIISHMINIIIDSVTQYCRKAISILLVAQKIVSLEVVNNFLVDDDLKEFADDIQVADRSILRQRQALFHILEDS